MNKSHRIETELKAVIKTATKEQLVATVGKSK